MLGNGEHENIPRSMRITAQKFNQRNRRKGAFWENRGHATAMEANQHFISGLITIDLNMVPAGG